MDDHKVNNEYNRAYENQSFKIIQSYFDNCGFVDHQIRSYNDFANFGLQEIFDQENVISVSPKPDQIYQIRFGNITIVKPHVIEHGESIPLYPGQARQRDLTYNGIVCCDIQEVIVMRQGMEDKEVKNVVHYRTPICKIPIMLKSDYCNLSSLSLEDQYVKHDECPNDPGGYFVIKGKERVLIFQVRALHNKVYVLKQKPSEKKYEYIAEIRSMSNETGHSVLVQANLGRDDRTLVFSLPHIKEAIPVAIVFKALGFSKEETIDLIGLNIDKAGKYNRFIRRDYDIVDDFEVGKVGKEEKGNGGKGKKKKEKKNQKLDDLIDKFPVFQRNALRYIGKYSIHHTTSDGQIRYAWQVLDADMFPHMGVVSNVKEKGAFLGMMVKKLILTKIGIRHQDDRDNYINRRADTAGPLIHGLFRQLHKRYMSELKTQLGKKKQCPDIISIINKLQGSITKGLQVAFTSGNWAAHSRGGSYVPMGVSQILDRMNHAATLSHLHRGNLPMGKEGKNTDIRQIHASQVGKLCPCETPEGKTAGIAINCTIMACLSKKISPVIVNEQLQKCTNIIPINHVSIDGIKDMTYVQVNGVLVGMTNYPEEVIDYVRSRRRMGYFDKQVSVSYDIEDDEINIFCDESRFLHPLLTMEDNKVLLDPMKNYNWPTLIKKGYIQYIDAAERQSSVIAMYPSDCKIQYNDYCEINPVTMLGVIAAMIPFPDHSQSPRNCYQSNMGKQALGITSLSKIRTDTISYRLHHPQRPLVTTKIADMLKYNEMPSGITAIVAISPMFGFNQEDSIVFNKAAIDRGLFRVTQYKEIVEMEKKRDAYTTELIGLPPLASSNEIKKDDNGYFKRKRANYSMLCKEHDVRCKPEECHPDCMCGIVRVGTHIRRGIVLIGKIIIKTDKDNQVTRTDVSRVADENESGIVDRIIKTISTTGHTIVKVTYRREKIPEIGDKFASRAAQKGTIGMIYNQEDLPFTSEGIVPDLIINPHCIPSRMTINQLIECVLGKYAGITGEFQDATPFTINSVNIADKICTKLKDLGMERMREGNYPVGTSLDDYSRGWETMRSGVTGEVIEAKIFIGPTYYQRLKHMVSEKIHSRAIGHVTTLTRQAIEGRKRDGGLRFGEMERDCMVAHGTSAFIEERLHKVSDPFAVHICNSCGSIATSTKECIACTQGTIDNVKMPYATKLLLHELWAMGIKTKLETGH